MSDKLQLPWPKPLPWRQMLLHILLRALPPVIAAASEVQN